MVRCAKDHVVTMENSPDGVDDSHSRTSRKKGGLLSCVLFVACSPGPILMPLFPQFLKLDDVQGRTTTTVQCARHNTRIGKAIALQRLADTSPQAKIIGMSM